MSDLVRKLRHEAWHTSYKQSKPWDLLVEAADELDRLTREIEEARKAAALYETARRMNPRQWAAAWEKNITTGKPFDEIVAEHANRKDALDRMARNADELGLDF